MTEIAPIPRLSPKIRNMSENMLNEIAETKRVRLAHLKKQVSSGSYQPSTKALAKSLLATG